MPQAPWEKYQAQPAAEGPWRKYQKTTGPSTPPPVAEGQSLPDRFYGAARAAATAMSPPGSFDAFGRAMDVGVGGVKEIGSTAYNVLKQTPGIGRLMPEEKPEFLEPSNTAQRVGGAIATAAEYAAPAAATGGLAAGIPGLAGGLARAGVEAATTAGVSKVRGATNEEAARDALIAGGFSGAASLLLKGAPAVGERIELGLLKPLKAELEQVKAPIGEAGPVMIKNLYKYDLGGTLADSFQKSTAKLNELGTQLRGVLKSQPGAQVDLGAVWYDTATALGQQPSKTFGTNKEISNALGKIAEEIDALGGGGKVDLADANEVKQALGVIGSWVNGQRTADSTALETVANAMYSQLRQAIETTAGQQGGAVKALNQTMGEIIPIRNAIIRRLPVAQRREVISLKEAIALARGDIGGLALAITDRGLRSGRVANVLVQAGKRSPAGIGAGTAGGVMTLRSMTRRKDALGDRFMY